MKQILSALILTDLTSGDSAAHAALMAKIRQRIRPNDNDLRPDGEAPRYQVTKWMSGRRGRS